MVRKKRSFSLLNFVSSMKSGMLLLILLAGYSTLGTLIPQGNLMGFYEENYSPLIFSLIRIFQLHRVYSSLYFIILTVLLSTNLIFCSIRRLPGTLNLYRKDLHLDSILKKSPVFEFPIDENTDPQVIFSHFGFRKHLEGQGEEGKIFYSVRRSLGYFGSYFVHLGLLIVILAFALGKVLGYETYLRGIPGDELSVTDTDITLKLQDFDILYREDYSVHQYVSSVELMDQEGEIFEAGEITVNHPLRTRGYKIYQNGTGWMLQLVAKEDGEEILRERFYQSGVVFLEEKNLAMEFRGFYPDFVLSEGKAYTKTPFLNNPRYLFTLYENGQSVYMNVASPGETISYGALEFQAFEPRLYTVLQVVRDPGAVFAGIGGAMMLLGLLLTFYYVPQYLVVKEKEGQLTLSGGAQKNKVAYRLFIEDRLPTLEDKGGRKA